MSRRTLQIALAAVAAVVTLATLAAPSFAGGCHTNYYGYRSCYAPRPVLVSPVRAIDRDAQQIFLMMQSRPDLVLRFPAQFAALQRQFGVVQPAIVAPVVVAPVVQSTTVVTPAIGPAVAPVATATTVIANTRVVAPAAGPVVAPAAGPVAVPAAGPPRAEAVATPAGQPAAPADLPAGPPAAAASPVPTELLPLMGLWRNVSAGPNGEENVTTLNLEANGNATLTVNSIGLGPVAVKRPFAVEDGQFTLKGDKDLVLGKVVSADKDNVVLDRGGVQLSFTRP